MWRRHELSSMRKFLNSGKADQIEFRPFILVMPYDSVHLGQPGLRQFLDLSEQFGYGVVRQSVNHLDAAPLLLPLHFALKPGHNCLMMCPGSI